MLLVLLVLSLKFQYAIFDNPPFLLASDFVVNTKIPILPIIIKKASIKTFL